MRSNFSLFIWGFLRYLRILGIFPYSMKKIFWFADINGESFVFYRKKLFAYHPSLFWKIWSFLFFILLVGFVCWVWWILDPLSSYFENVTKTLSFSLNLYNIISFASIFAYYGYFFIKKDLLAYILNFGEMFKREQKMKCKNCKNSKLIHLIIWFIFLTQIIAIILCFHIEDKIFEDWFKSVFHIILKTIIIMIGTGMSVIFYFLSKEIVLFYETIFSRHLIISEKLTKENGKQIFRYLEEPNNSIYNFHKIEKRAYNIYKESFRSFFSCPSMKNSSQSSLPVISKQYISYCQKSLLQIYNYQSLINECFGSFIVFLLANIILTLVISMFYSCIPNISLKERFISINLSVMPLSQLFCIVDSAYNVDQMVSVTH